MDSISILVADDNVDDCILMREAFFEAKLNNPLEYVHNGKELIDYLKREDKYESLKDKELPGLILLDLNMPKMDGREALKIIKSDPGLRLIPIVVFSTSKAQEDIYRSYDLGVNSFISKPLSFDDFINVIQTLGKYWFKIVKLPSDNQE